MLFSKYSLPNRWLRAVMNVANPLGQMKSWGLKMGTEGERETILCDYYFNPTSVSEKQDPL